MSKTSILIIEDEKPIIDFLCVALTPHYNVRVARDGASGLTAVEEAVFDIILLDLGLPDTDGMAVLKEIKANSDTPVIVVSARQLEEEKVSALDLGADDYVTKPFGNKELLARIRRTLRQQEPVSTSYQLNDFSIDYDKRMVKLGGEPVHLTPIEFGILMLLCQNAGKVMTHEQIITKVWGPYESDRQILRVNMANIRRKLEKNPADPIYILTEVGVGYRMADLDDFSH